jgi:hypothetical protein
LHLLPALRLLLELLHLPLELPHLLPPHLLQKKKEKNNHIVPDSKPTSRGVGFLLL